MSGMQLSGLSTGIDTQALVQQLMAVEKQKYNSYSLDKKVKESRIEYWNQIEQLIKSFQSAAKSLCDADTLKSFKTTISDNDKITVNATSSAYEGTHGIQIKQLATSCRLVHKGYEYDTDIVDNGKFIYSYNNKEIMIDVPQGTTLKELVGLINNDDNNPGVTASLMKYDNGQGGVYHLVMSGNASGSNYEINIASTNSQICKSEAFKIADDKNASLKTKIQDLAVLGDKLAGSDASGQIVIEGTRHDGTAFSVNFNVNDDSTMDQLLNEINKCFKDVNGDSTARATFEDGVFTVMDMAEGASQMSITGFNFVQGAETTAMPAFSITSQGGTIESGMNAFTAADAFIETQKAQDSLIKVDGYPEDIFDSQSGEVLEEKWISNSSNSIDGVIDGVTLTLHDVTEDDEEIKVGLTKNTSKVKTQLQGMISSYNELVGYLKDLSKYDSESKSAGPLLGDSTVRSIVDQIRTPFFGTATGFDGNSDTFTLASQIGIDIKQDGTMELDSGKFDEALKEDYDAVFELIGASDAGRTSGGNVEMFAFTSSQSYTEPGEYDIKVEYDGSGVASAYIKLKTESEWRQATISNGKIIGSLEKDSRDNYYPERGLVLSFDAPESTAGTYTTSVSVKQGLAGKVRGLLDSIIDKDHGSVTLKKNAIKSNITRIEDSMEKEMDRLEKKEEDLKLKYARLEATIQSMQQQLQASGLLGMIGA